ncbi:MAG: NUDIX domain-containing protein [Mariniphaga sp.]
MTEKVRVLKTEILSDNCHILSNVTFEFQKKDGTVQTQSSEIYNKRDGATILLFNRVQKTVILSKQFRLPTFLTGNKSGMLIEACAGFLDSENAEECIKRETEEELGYKISNVQKIFEAYMAPGYVTGILSFFVAEYSKELKVTNGGGVENEEDIEVLEINIDKALKMIESAEIKDGKTIILLQYVRLHHLI